MPLYSATAPFQGHRLVSIIPPSDGLQRLDPASASALQRLPLQLASEASQLARELGAPVVVGPHPEATGTWLIGPHAHNPAMASWPPATRSMHHLDREAGLLRTDAPDVAGVLQTFSRLRSLSRLAQGEMSVDHCTSVEEAIERILVEVHDSWAGRHLRQVDWAGLSRPHVWRVRAASNPVEAMQRWLAELGDFHTWVRPARMRLVLPYGATVLDGEVVLTHVADWTEAFQQGVRPGYRLVGEDVASMWRSTPSSPHARPQTVARRLLSGLSGQTRVLEARGPGGHWVRWSETFKPPTGTPASWSILPDGTGSLWIGAWIEGLGVEEVLDEAFEAFANCRQILVDLRGNGGGRLAMAERFRRRFLSRRTRLGSIRTTAPGGRLGPHEVLWGEPAETGRYTGRVRFLTSPLTYSSSEDALLGLQGLEQVQVWGEPSGGGSGRNRRIKLLPGWRLTVSTALTYDRQGHCVEGQGIPVDHPVQVDRRQADGRDPVYQAAWRSPW